jgi:hypothetical protein
LHRIGVGRDLIEQHQGARGGSIQDAHDLSQVRREGREVGGDGLVVADRRLDVVVPAHP